jgi:hypothetical protein
MVRTRRSSSRQVLPLLLGLATCLGGGCSSDDTVAGPTAAFTLSPLCDLVPALSLTADVSTAGDAPIVIYAWDFHDGISAFGMSPEHRWGSASTDPVTVEITLSVIDGNGHGAADTQFTALTSCLSVGGSSVTVDGTAATPHVSLTNNSTTGDASVVFSLDVVGSNGLPLALDLDGGQHGIASGQTVDVFSVLPFDCGNDCGALATATVVPHVKATYWCEGPCS